MPAFVCLYSLFHLLLSCSLKLNDDDDDDIGGPGATGQPGPTGATGLRGPTGASGSRGLPGGPGIYEASVTTIETH